MHQNGLSGLRLTRFLWNEAQMGISFSSHRMEGHLFNLLDFSNRLPVHVYTSVEPEKFYCLRKQHGNTGTNLASIELQ